MKKPLVIGISLAVLLISGCVDREAEARKAKAEAEAKARAEAARREMETLPKVFQTPDYFKRNEPEKVKDPEPTGEKSKSKT